MCGRMRPPGGCSGCRAGVAVAADTGEAIVTAAAETEAVAGIVAGATVGLAMIP